MRTQLEFLVQDNQVNAAPATANVGLWLDKFIQHQTRDDKDSRHGLVQQVADIAEPEEYRTCFERWEKSLEDCGVVCRKAQVLGRMVVGMGDESTLEASITLHHTYGMPYIPGSALKGLAASFAHQYLGDGWKIGSPAYATVFGTTQSAGYITFFDALYVPHSGHGSKALHADVLTVHHEGYYQSDAPPADWDDPNPVPFLSATGNYLLALAGPEQWVTATFKILEWALAEAGIGAKTASGYGRMQLEREPLDPDRQQADALIRRVEALRPQEVAGSIQQYYQQWCQLQSSPAQKRRVAEAIIAKVQKSGRARASANQDWYKELLVSLQ